MIVACDKFGAIGRGNKIPWYLPEDLQHFKRVTLGKPIIMGRKTFESIGKPLPGRYNIVVSRNGFVVPEGVTVVHSIEDAIAEAASCTNYCTDEVMVIGGEQIYRSALSITDRIYRTEVDVLEDNADAFFPELDSNEWEEVQTQLGKADSNIPYKFVVLDRSDKLDFSKCEDTDFKGLKPSPSKDKTKKGKALLAALKAKKEGKQSILERYTPPKYDDHYNQSYTLADMTEDQRSSHIAHLTLEI